MNAAVGAAWTPLTGCPLARTLAARKLPAAGNINLDAAQGLVWADPCG